MKKIATWLVVLSFVVFIIDWGIVGLKIFDGDYDITIGAYIGLISIVVFFIGVLSLKFNNRCQNCKMYFVIILKRQGAYRIKKTEQELSFL